MMKGRESITLLGGAAVTWPLAARAQQPSTPVVVFLHPGASEIGARDVAAFRKGLQESGYVEGQNVTVEWSAPLGVDRRDAFQLAICRAWSSSNLTGLLYPSAECRRLALWTSSMKH